MLRSWWRKQQSARYDNDSVSDMLQYANTKGIAKHLILAYLERLDYSPPHLIRSAPSSRGIRDLLKQYVGTEAVARSHADPRTHAPLSDPEHQIDGKRRECRIL